MYERFISGTVLFIILIGGCLSFNIEVKAPTSFSGSDGEYFGYSVAFHKANGAYWALVGAILSNSTGTLTQNRNGALYRCPINNSSACINMAVDDTAPTSSEIKVGQQLGANVLSLGNNKGIMTCAPRFKDRSGANIWLHGRCAYVDGQNFQQGSKFWNPCVNERTQTNAGFGYCTAGFSAVIARQNIFVAGLPGVQQSVGRLAFQNILNIKDESGLNGRVLTTNDRITADNMMGYSVTWGMFSPSSLLGNVVGGAPSGSKKKGKVIVYQLNSNFPVYAVLENPDTAMAIGSYFGAALCAVDLTNDKISDLVVGAPLFSTNRDEGKAYIYITDQRGAINLKGSITGDGTIGARFGSSISSPGDLNADGYNDLIVGAPFGGTDGKGAVYIYHGSASGLGNNYQPVQKIYASSIPGTPSSFGHAISGGLDVDDNGYADFIVGSFLSDKVHVFKTKPVLRFVRELKTNVTKISLSKNSTGTCKVEGSSSYQCLQLQFCATYSGTGVPNSIDLIVKYELDKDQLAGKRAFFISGASKLSEMESTVTYNRGTQNCQTKTVYVLDNLRNSIRPITMAVSYDYREPAGGCNGKPCPVIDMYQTKSVSIQATYVKDCGSDDVCNANLVVKASPVLSKGETELVFGKVKTFSVKIEVTNKGEDAFLSKMNVAFSNDFKAAGVDFVNQQSPLWERQNEKDDRQSINFNLDNPFSSNQKLDIVVKFTIAKDRPSKKSLIFNIKATSVSNETVEADNSAVVTVTSALQADLTVSGSASPDKFFYDKVQRAATKDLMNETQVGPVVDYSFLIQNLGPSPVQGLYSRVSLVTKHNNKWLLMLFSAQVEGSISCSLGNKLNPLNLTASSNVQSRKRREASVAQDGTTVLNCRTATCITFDCYMGLLKQGESRTVKLRTRLFQNTFIEEKRGPTQLNAKISIVIPQEEKQFLRQPVNHKPDDAVVSIQISPPVSKTEGKKEAVAWWIILLSVLGALLLIGVVVFVLWKVGFFKRKLKGKKITGPTDNDDEMLD